MKVRKTLLVAAAGWAGLATQAVAQIPAVPGAVPPVAAPLGTPVPATAAPPTTIWQKLGLGKDQKAACKAQICATPLGQLINNAKMPLTLLSGGLIPPFCPLMPTAAQLADPGAEGAAAAIQADEAGAKARRAAVRYLGTVDCHYWPEAGDALIAALRGDRNECVRWEAALALSRGCCCTKKTIEALSIVVSCSDRDGAPKETSYRVHAAAAAALDHCLACYANVATAPVQGERPIERTTPPTETLPPPAPPLPPVTPPPPPETSAAKAFSPGEAKPAAGLTAITPPPVVVKRPVGPEYYSRIAKAPLAEVLAEARRVAERMHNSPVIADTPFETQGHSVATLMSYATGPDTQAVIPAGMTVPASEVRAEVVSAKPANLWDLLSKPSDQGQVVAGKTETVVVQPPPPPPKSVVVKREVIVPKPEVVVKQEPFIPKPEWVAPLPGPVIVKPEPVAPKPEPVAPMPTPIVVKQEPVAPRPEPVAPMPGPVVVKQEPVAKKSALTPAPAPTPLPKPEPLTLDFPPPDPMLTEAPPAGPSPYYATAATRAISNRPTEPVSSAVSSYHPTAATVSAGPVPTAKNTPTPSPYNAVMTPAPAKPAPVVKAAPAPLPTPAVMPATPMPTRPMPAPAALVVPAASVGAAVPVPTSAAVPAMPANGELVEHLLKTAKGDGPIEVRKASIQELAKMKANTPEVMVALDGLSDDPAPGVRAEAIIAAARLRMGQ